MSRRDGHRSSYDRGVGHDDSDDDNDNAESLRSRKRRKGSGHGHEDDEDNKRNHGTVANDDHDRTDHDDHGGHSRRPRHGQTSSSAASRSRDFDSEREQRMARLRQQLKEEDEDLGAVDQGGGDAAGQPLPKPQEEIIEVNQEELEGMDEEEQMKRLLGFDGFGSTKGQAVEDNHSSAARGVAAKNKARKYRQYMNRKNGFNRPLEKMN